MANTAVEKALTVKGFFSFIAVNYYMYLNPYTPPPHLEDLMCKVARAKWVQFRRKKSSWKLENMVITFYKTNKHCFLQLLANKIYTNLHVCHLGWYYIGRKVTIYLPVSQNKNFQKILGQAPVRYWLVYRLLKFLQYMWKSMCWAKWETEAHLNFPLNMESG